MSKYSSDSDTSESSRYQKRKSKRRSRSSSSSSNDSRYSSKKRSYKHKRSKGHRSRSRDKYSRSRNRHSRDETSRSAFSSRSSSSVKHRKSSRDRSRSGSRDRSSGKRKRRPKRRSRSPSKGHSKYRSTSSSSSNNHSHTGSNSPISVDSRTTSQAGSAKQEPSSEDQLRAKLQQAIKAAQSADDLLRQQGFLTGVSSRKDDVIKEPSASILDEINSPSFVPKNFISQSSATFTPDSASEGAVKVVNMTLPVSTTEVKDNSTSIFHPSLLVDSDQKLEKWVKKLFNLRQKAINGEPIA